MAEVVRIKNGETNKWKQKRWRISAKIENL